MKLLYRLLKNFCLFTDSIAGWSLKICPNYRQQLFQGWLLFYTHTHVPSLSISGCSWQSAKNNPALLAVAAVLVLRRGRRGGSVCEQHAIQQGDPENYEQEEKLETGVSQVLQCHKYWMGTVIVIGSAGLVLLFMDSVCVRVGVRSSTRIAQATAQW